MIKMKSTFLQTSAGNLYVSKDHATESYTIKTNKTKQTTTKKTSKSKKKEAIKRLCKKYNIIIKTDSIDFESNLTIKEVAKKYKSYSSNKIMEILTIISHHLNPESFFHNNMIPTMSYNYENVGDEMDGDYYPDSGSFTINNQRIFSIKSMTLQCGMRSLFDMRAINIPYGSYDFVIKSQKKKKTGVLCFILGLRTLENTKNNLVYIASGPQHSFQWRILDAIGKKIYSKQNPNTGEIIDYFILDYQTLLEQN